MERIITKNYQRYSVDGFFENLFRNFKRKRATFFLSFLFCYCTRRDNRIESNENEMSNLRGRRTQRKTERGPSSSLEKGGEEHHFEVGCCIVHFALCPSPSAAEIQINDKSASAFQPSSPYFIPLSQYSIPFPLLLPNIGNQPEGLLRLLLLFLFCSLNARISINEFFHILEERKRLRG